jgi:hypothetical protein
LASRSRSAADSSKHRKWPLGLRNFCWTLWRERQRLTGDDVSSARAEVAVLTHLARIETVRPLANITDPGRQAKAEQVRAWFRKGFLDGLLD